MFSKLSFNNIADSISNAAQRTQEQLNSALEKIHLDDPETRLSLLKRKHQLQETLGTIQDISQLPVQYKFLEQKSDALEKICRRLLIVTKTYEVEGYDYPPNLTESLNDWWSLNKEGLFAYGKKKTEVEPKEETRSEAGLIPRSFAQALSKATTDSAVIMKELKAEKLKSATKVDGREDAVAETMVEDLDEDETEDEDVENMIKLFESWTKCAIAIDQSKEEMDKLIIKEFNEKLTKIIEEDFKKGHILRSKVEDSRLKFDTLRYELKLKEQQQEMKEKAQDPIKDEEPDTGGKMETENAQTKEEEETKTNEVSPAESHAKDPDSILFEQLEDQFVSVTSETVEYLGELTDSSEMISLIKLFHNFQLIHYRQCVKSLEESMSSLNMLESDDK